ncbi:MAG: hypothetical protein B7Y42_16220 [Polaromonas sp. 28-63-22]|nr:MAG: hypothetical protein B7Y42_16220 [Polaromonas sp. 28-63-22]
MGGADDVDAAKAAKASEAEKIPPQPLPPGARKPARPLQQQAQRPADRQQQQSGSSPEFQPKSRPGPASVTGKGDKPDHQMGEGSYEGTRDYQESVKGYLKTADVKSDAKAAKPSTPEEAEALKKAEREGLSHSKAPGQ